MKLPFLPSIQLLCIFSILTSTAEITFCSGSGQKASDTIQLAEKVYLHIDRKSYTSSEDVWFRAYVIDPATGRLSENTNNLYVDFISPDDKIVMRRTVRTIKGLGKGDFFLPDPLPSDVYRIRAYTNHMRNYDEAFYFTREITVVNPYDSTGFGSRTEKAIVNSISISLFPEGGSLVENVTSSVAFKAINSLGRGCDVTVELYNSDDELMTVFTSTHLGMGFFNIKPLPGKSYYVIARAKDGSETSTKLPAAFTAGITIRTALSADKDLILTTCTNDVTLSYVRGKDMNVNISSRNLKNKSLQIRIDSLENNFLLPLDDMPSGIIRVTLAEFEGMPLAERLFFLERNEAQLIVETDKATYPKRGKVNLILKIAGDTSFSGEGDFSLSAVKSDYYENSSAYPQTIASWFLLESDVKGVIEEPSWYFDPANKKRDQALDLLLMTQGWRDFSWKYDSVNSFKHEVGFDITGVVKRVITGKPVAGAKINLGLFFADQSLFQSTKTAKDGIFRFDQIEFYGRTEAFISSTDNLERIEGKILVDSLLHNVPEASVLQRDTIVYKLIEREIPLLRQEAVIRDAEKRKYKLSDTIRIGEVEVVATRVETPQEVKVREVRKFYSTPDKEKIVTVSEENYGGDVFQYISGRIPGVIVERGVNPKSIYFPDDVLITIRRQFIQEGVERASRIGALILLDGYEVDSASLGNILNLPMKAIDRIDVLSSSPLYGMRGANGVINIITKVQLKRDPVSLNINSSYLVLKGFDVPRLFYSPDYDKPSTQANAPDFRSTLFWKPDLRIEKNKTSLVSYFNTDESGKVLVVVEGMTKDGIPLYGNAMYEVK